MGKTYCVLCIDCSEYGGGYEYGLDARMPESDAHEKRRFGTISEMRVYAAANGLSVDESMMIPVMRL